MIRDKSDQKQVGAWFFAVVGRTPRRVHSNFRRFSARLAATLAAMAGLALASLPFGTRESVRPAPQSEQPDIQVTRVQAHSGSKAAARTEVEIRWTAFVPAGTKIEEFEVLLEARYTDGSKGAARIRHLKPSARAVLLSLATHPRRNSTALLGDFKASVKVSFSVASSFAVFHDVPLTIDDSPAAEPDTSSGGQPEVLITAAKLVPQGCASGHHCVDVSWSATAANNITINEFAVSIVALHKDGTRISDFRIVGSRSRNARLMAGSVDSEVFSLRITVLTSFFVRDSRTAVNTGTFI
jgi:hypothetical protein